MQLNFNKTEHLLKKYKIPYCESVLCKKTEDALKAIKKIRYPAVLKISSKNIIHKSDVGGVITNIKNEKELKKSFESLLKKFEKKKIKINGIILQKQKTGKEIIVGMKKDKQFGPVIMFGMGGIFVEVFKDVSFRIAPIDKKEARKMIEETKSYEILKGIRGKKSVNINALTDILEKLSKMIMKETKILELDFNPIIVNQKTAEVVDARIIE